MACVSALGVSACGTAQFEFQTRRIDDLEKELIEVKKQLATQTVLSQNLETDLFTFKDRLETVERNRARRVRSAEELDTVKVRPQNGPEAVFDSSSDDPSADLPVARRDDPGREPDCDLPDMLTEDGHKIPGCGKGSSAKGPTARVSPLPKGGPPIPAAPKVEPRVHPSPKASDHAAKDAYDAAMGEYKAGRMNEATDSFLDFVQRFPAHEYADNALYWAGECFYSRALWNKALQHVTDVLANYPMENKTSDAMLKIGLCYVNLGKTDAAREALEQVIEIYPDTPVANLARQKLGEL